MERDDEKSAKDDQAWFDGLRGKNNAGQGARLGRILREAEQTEAEKENTTHDWQRLQFAMRRESRPMVKKTGLRLRYVVLAASLLIVAGTVSLMMQPRERATQSVPQERTRMRGTTEQVLFSAAPSKEADQLESELKRLGIKVTRSSTAGKIEMRIPLSYPVQDEVRAALEARVIPVPEQGDLTVVFISNTK